MHLIFVKHIMGHNHHLKAFSYLITLYSIKSHCDKKSRVPKDCYVRIRVKVHITYSRTLTITLNFLLRYTFDNFLDLTFLFEVAKCVFNSYSS